MNNLRRAQYVMGTEVEMIVFAPEPTASTAAEAAFCEVERIERLFNVFDESSELSRVNRCAAREPVAVSPEVFEIVARGIAYSFASEGCFSICVGPLMRLWRNCAEADRYPADSELAEAHDRSDPQRIRLDRARSTIAFETSGMALDLGGLVKGYAVDRAREAVVKSGVARALISAGESSLAAFGRPVDEPWEIGVRHPRLASRLAGTLSLHGRAVSTSGTSERGFSIRGERFSHLLDPRSARPLSGDASATAVCSSATIAEVASKLLLFLGCERGIGVCDANGWEIEGATCVAQAAGPGVWVEQTDGLNMRVWGVAV